MEEAEPPECPVCMQPYDTVSAIPRVLPCGHTTCETCLNHLPNPYPKTVRCTVCTVLVKFPNHPSNLPKNIDLLYYSSISQNNSTKDKKVISLPSSESEKNQLIQLSFVPDSWSYEFYCKWKRWVLGKDSILIEETGCGSENELVCGLIDGESVSLVKVGIFIEREEDSRFFKCSYVSRIVSVLHGIGEKKLSDLEFVLNAFPRACNEGKVYGFWYDEKDMCVYMVCEKFDSPNLVKCVVKRKEDEVKCVSDDEIRGLAMVAMDICEVVGSLHSQGMVFGFLDTSCFSLNRFGRVYVDVGAVFNMRRRIDVALGRICGDLEECSKNDVSDVYMTFISPEVLVQVLSEAGFELDRDELRYEVTSSSDVWSLGFLFVWLIVGSSIGEAAYALMQYVCNAKTDDKGHFCCDFYTDWLERIVCLLGDKLGKEYVSLNDILCRCLEYDPVNRPRITEVWKCLRELVVKPQFDIGVSFYQEAQKNSDQRVVLGELFLTVKESKNEHLDSVPSKDDNGMADRDVIEGVSKGHVRCVELKGHANFVTGLATGGGFLFSSSYDKTVNVWSLQDLSLMGSFKSHEHRITAIVFVDGEQPLCISGDNEGVICIWDVSFPFTGVPIKKLYEEKDWRYSGIHAMTISGTDYLYTGSGDTLVKAWSLKDYTLSCGMSGHKSVVSALEICNGVLYSGSWDGTVRLWSMSDHSSLAVLGEGNLRPISIMSLSVENNLLIAGQENGCIKIWHNDIILKSIEVHKGAVFSVSKKGKWLLSGGWDKTVNVQEISEDADGIDITPVGSIACNSPISALIYTDGKLFVGQADRDIKVYFAM